MSAARLAARQVRWATLAYLRNPPAVFFGLLMPVLFLVIFATVFGNDTIQSRGGISQSTYYVPGLIALGIVSTTFVNLALGLVVLRENRVLKRLRGTPLPAPAFLAGRVATAVGMAAALTVVLLVIGRVAYGAELPGSTAPGVVLALVVGAASFCSLGVAFSTLVPNEDAGPAVVNAAVLPLYFISGVFFPTDEAPGWLNDVAAVFPVKHLAEALLEAFEPGSAAPGIAWGHLGIVALWGIAGALAAVFTFRWTPKGGVMLNHVALTVSDRERSAAFYAEHFGMTERVHQDDHLLILAGEGGALLALSVGEPPTPLPRTNHFGFMLEDAAAVRAARERFAAAGLEQSESGEQPERVQVLDPDGYRVEVYAY